MGFALLALSVVGLGYSALLIGAGVISFGVADQAFGLVDYLEALSVGLVGFGVWRCNRWVIPVGAWLAAGMLVFMAHWLLTSSHAGEWQAVTGLHSFLFESAAPWWWHLVMAGLVVIGLVAALTDPAFRSERSKWAR